MDVVDDNEVRKIIDFKTQFSTFTTNYTLLTVFHIPGKAKNNHRFWHHANITFLELYTQSRSGGAEFDLESDNEYLDEIIKTTYSFNLVV
jgi:hypothetical protein